MADSEPSAGSYTEKVVHYLYSADLGRVRETQVCEHLCGKRKALRAHLKSEGTRFKILLSAERKRRTLALLARNPYTDLAGIAKATGHRTPGAASTGFTKLFGVTLQQYRRHASTAAQDRLIDVSVLMAQELQEIVEDADEAVAGGYHDEPMADTKELLKDWEEAYTACDFPESRRFENIRHYLEVTRS